MKNADSAGAKGYDAGKKVSGIKRHIAVDTQGFPHAIAVTTANVTDRKGALLALSRQAADLQSVKRVLADGGYIGQRAARRSRRDRQTLCVAYLCRHATTLDCRTILCLAGEVPPTLEKLRAQAQHQLAVRPFSLPGTHPQKIVNRFLGVAAPLPGSPRNISHWLRASH